MQKFWGAKENDYAPNFFKFLVTQTDKTNPIATNARNLVGKVLVVSKLQNQNIGSQQMGSVCHHFPGDENPLKIMMDPCSSGSVVEQTANDFRYV